MVNRKRFNYLPSVKVQKELRIYKFPSIQGLEDISSKLNKYPSENIFGALLHVFLLKPITNETSAKSAERMLEYLLRAFEDKQHSEVQYYCHILSMLLKEYDNKQHTRASKGLLPHEFLRALLIEDGTTQKSLVPECFATTSQVSEFLQQRKGRDKLRYEQAVVLGNRFHVDPLNFLQ